LDAPTSSSFFSPPCHTWKVGMAEMPQMAATSCAAQQARSLQCYACSQLCSCHGPQAPPGLRGKADGCPPGCNRTVASCSTQQLALQGTAPRQRPRPP
jgi:hypothetical protein